jgi:hypothetical protein
MVEYGRYWPQKIAQNVAQPIFYQNQNITVTVKKIAQTCGLLL